MRSLALPRHLHRAAWVLLAAGYALAQPSVSAPASRAASAPAVSDIPKTFTAALSGDDYIRREVMIPMRDGVKLFTVIVVPKGAHDAPILLTRTPYNAARRTERSASLH